LCYINQHMRGWRCTLVALAALACCRTAGAEPAAPAAGNTLTAQRHRLLLLPFVGVQSFQEGYNSQAYDLGLRGGTLVGWHFLPWGSLNGEVALERFKTGGYTERTWEWTFSPLGHLSDGRVEFVLGPTVGYWSRADQWESRALLAPRRETDRGWAMGVNAGVFVVTKIGVSVGGLFGLQDRHDTRYCHTFSDGVERCEGSHLVELWMLSASAAVLY
jgi:hypothetical protein